MKLPSICKALGLLVLGLSAAGCTSPVVKDIKVSSDVNPKINFSGYKTYAWAAAAMAVNDPDGEWSQPGFDIGAEIQQITNRELRAKGWTQVASAPDVLVMYAVGIDMKSLDVVTDKESGFDMLEVAPKGAVTLILADPDTRRVMWVGTADGKAGEHSTKDTQERIDYAITKMLKKSPI